MAEIEHWKEWKQKCALGLCGTEARRELREFARMRFHRFAEAYCRGTGANDANALTPDAGEAWHLFETHFCLSGSREGKRYKEWLFVRPRVDRVADLDSIQGGATLIMRDVVRERLRREVAPRWIASLDAPAACSQDGSSLTLGELLPAALECANDMEYSELERMAETDAEGIMAALERRERIAILANALGLSLAHPAVVRIADCSKSALNNAFHSALSGMAGHVRAQHPREISDILATLACLVFKVVQKRILKWGKLESECAQLSVLVESGPRNGIGCGRND